MNKAKGRIFRRSKAHTMYISVPSVIVMDSRFPFSRNGEPVIILIDNDRLIIKKEEKDNDTNKEGMES
ncbi:MAG: hypothetical protein ACTSRP_21840 [Candidatus Helarchaeota archaeon]